MAGFVRVLALELDGMLTQAIGRRRHRARLSWLAGTSGKAGTIKRVWLNCGKPAAADPDNSAE
jgi:hypothetical protein